MNRYSFCVRALLAFSMVLGCVSVSQAGLFGRWRASYYEETYYCPTVVVETPYAYAPATAPASPVAASPSGTMPYTVAKPVVEGSAAVSGPTPQGGYYVPAPAVIPSSTYAPAPVSSGSWSTTPRSSWDFGKYPPYSN